MSRLVIKTDNLDLFPYERVHVAAFLSDRRELADLLQVSIPDGWPQFPEAFSLSDETEPAPSVWHGYFFILRQDRVLVGSGGFAGTPDASGAIELGYEIAPNYWNRGYATEVVRRMLGYAFAQPDVRSVIAHTLANPNASNRVLQKVGMKYIAELDDAEEGKIWRWQISRDDYHPA